MRSCQYYAEGFPTNGRILEEFRDFERDVSQGADGGPDCALVFSVVEKSQSRAEEELDDPLQIVPELRYVRKDGTPGRFGPFIEDRYSEGASPSEKALLELYRLTGEREVGFGQVLPFLLTHGDLELYRKNGRIRLPLRLFELGIAVVSFKLRALWQNNAPLYSPVILLRAPDDAADQGDATPAEELHAGISGMSSYFYAGYSPVVYFCQEPRPGIGQLALLAGKQTYFRSFEIKELHRVADREILWIEPPADQIDLRNEPPTLKLLLSPEREFTLIHVLVRYGNRAIGVRERAPLVVGEPAGGVQRVYARDRASERAHIRAVESLLSVSIGRSSSFALSITLPELLFRFEQALQDLQCELYMRETGLPVTAVRKLIISASSGIDWLDLQVSVDGRPTAPKDLDLDIGLVHTERAYKLLDPESLRRLRKVYSSGRAGKDAVKVNRFDLVGVMDICELVNGEVDEEFLKLKASIARIRRGFTATDVPKPPGMKGMLRAYQKAGLSWLLFLKEHDLGGILADDMGLGKTIQAIALIAQYASEGNLGPFLVVAPVSTITNWVREFARFLPLVSVWAHLGPDRHRVPLDQKTHIVVTSYHTLQRDIVLFRATRWEVLVLDESQVLKNHLSKSHQAVSLLDRGQTVAMSGTPVENNIGELWSIMRILNPGLFRGRTEFLRHYRKPLTERNDHTIAELKRRINPFLLRRTKRSVALDLPKKKEISVHIALSSEEYRFYLSLKETLRSEALSLLASDEPFRAGAAILAALTKLRQAAIAPSLVGGPMRSSKLDTVLRKVREGLAEDHKIIIFSQYVRVLELIKERLLVANMEYLYLDGSVPGLRRKESIGVFQSSDRYRLFLISLKAGGVGINLTEADYVFLVDPWWNPAVENQAVDRAHRIGQTKPVFAYRFVAEGTVEEHIVELQNAKRVLTRDVIGEDAEIFKSLSQEEIIDLF